MDADAERWIQVRVQPVNADTFRQENRGRPGANTRCRKTTTQRLALSATVRIDVVTYHARMDGVFPLITNDKAMSPTGVLAAYKYQPNLERRHGQLKGHSTRRPCAAQGPGAHRGTPVLPLLRPRRPSAHQT